MQQDLVNVTLETLANGGAAERFNDELARVVENTLDPNTTGVTREITLKVKMKPNDERDFCSVHVSVTSKLGAAKPVETRMFIGYGPDGPCATEVNPSREPMLPGIKQEPQQEQPTTTQIAAAAAAVPMGNVTPLRPAAGQNNQ